MNVQDVTSGLENVQRTAGVMMERKALDNLKAEGAALSKLMESSVVTDPAKGKQIDLLA